MILDAAEQAPPEATAEQVRAAEELLVAKATGDATRSGRPTDARRLRQVARRMFDPVDRDLADRHEAIILGRETRTAEAETFFALHDNGNGTFSGKFLIPELHGHLLRHALERLTAPRRLSRDRAGELVTDPTALGTGCGANLYEVRGAAFLELVEHLPTTGHGPNSAELLVTVELEALMSGLGTAGLDTGVRITAGDARRSGLRGGAGARGARRQVRPARPRAAAPAPRRQPASCPLPPPRHLRGRRVRPTVCVVRDPPPRPLVAGRAHRPRPMRSPPAATTTDGRTTRRGTCDGAATASGPSTGADRPGAGWCVDRA